MNNNISIPKDWYELKYVWSLKNWDILIFNWESAFEWKREVKRIYNKRAII